MGLRQIKSKPVGTPTFGAPASITPTFDANGYLSLSCTPVAGASGYLWRGMWEEDALNPDDPFKWWELSPRPVGPVLNRLNSPLVSAFAWDGEIITIQVAAVDKDGTQSAWTTTTFTAPNWAEGLAISNWSRDLTKAPNPSGLLGWAFTNGSSATGSVTVSGAVGSQVLTFASASQTWEQKVPSHPLGGRQYDLYLEIQGTAGQTIQVFANSGNGADNWAQTITLTGAKQLLKISRPAFAAGNTDRWWRFGLQTYGGSTARVVTVYNLMALPGGSAQPAAGLTITNRVWCEPAVITAGGTYPSWHKSALATVPQTQVTTTANVILTGRYDGRGVLCALTYSGSLDIVGVRSRARNPMAAGRLHGYIVQGDYLVRLVITNNLFRHHAAISTQFWRGRGAGNTYIVTDNIVLDNDGRYIADSLGNFRLNSYGNNQDRPDGLTYGWEAQQFIRLNQMDKGGVDPDGVTGAEFARNLIINRPGHSRTEDLLNFSRFRGTPSSYIQVHDNLIWHSTPWDWRWHLANDITVKYNYGKILTDNITVTITLAAPAGIGATSLTVTPRVPWSIPSGTVLDFGNNLKATLSAKGVWKATALAVQPLGAAIPSGAVATYTFSDGPATHSGTAILVSDMFGNNTGSFENNSAYIRAWGNIGIGEGAYIGAQSGNSQEFWDNWIYYSGFMYGGVVKSSGHRVPTVSFNNFNFGGATAPDRTGVVRTIQFDTIAYDNSVFGGLAAGEGSMTPATRVFSNRRSATCTPDMERQAMADWYQREIIRPGYTLGPSA